MMTLLRLVLWHGIIIPSMPERLERMPLLVLLLQVPLLLLQFRCRRHAMLRLLLRPGRVAVAIHLLWLPPSIGLVPVHQCMKAVSPVLGPTLVVFERVWHLRGRCTRGRSRSPSRTSSRGGSASPGGEKHSSQLAASYKIPIGGASADILADIDTRVSSSSSGMRSRKVSKLLQYQGVRSRKFYRFEGENITKAKALNYHVTELAGLCTFDNLKKTDVTWSSTEAEDMEAALQSIVEITS